MNPSKFLSLGQREWIKAFWMFLFTTIIGVVGDALMQAINLQSYSIDAIHWKEIGLTVLTAVIGYLKMKLLSNSNGEILTKEPK